MDTHLEVVVIPVSDVDRAKAFYSMLGWRLDADVSGDEYRLVQFTSPGTACSVLSNHKESRGQVLFCIHNRWIKDVPPTAGGLGCPLGEYRAETAFGIIDVRHRDA